MEFFKELKRDFQNVKSGLIEDRLRLTLFGRELLTKEGWNDPANANKILYMLAIFSLLISFLLFMHIDGISIEYILPIYIFFVDEMLSYFLVFASLSLYMFVSRPDVGKGLVAVVLSFGMINFLFVHIYADKYSLEKVGEGFYQDKLPEKKNLD